jgi:transcriptional regulator with XRE-family HTH domain
MTIDNFSLVIPAREIKYLMKLRHINQRDIEAQAGISYTVLSKFLSTTDRRSINYKKAPHIRKAIAEALDVPFDDLWGEKGKQILDALIDKELERIKQEQLKERKRIFIGSKHRWSIIRFIKNLIYLGKPGIYLKTYRNEKP